MTGMLIKNGTVVDGTGAPAFRADVRIRDGVIAEVDGEWTIKYFRKQGKAVYLEAANPKYPAIRPKAELRLGGVVTAAIRKYHR